MERDRFISNIDTYDGFCIEEIVKYFLTQNNYTPLYDTYNGLEFLFDNKRIIVKDFLKEEDINLILDCNTDNSTWIVFLDSRKYKDKYFRCYLVKSFDNNFNKFYSKTIDSLFYNIKNDAEILYDGEL